MRRNKIPVDGRTAFISGAASGIGRAMVQRLAAHGCPVAIADTDAAGLQETADLAATPVLARSFDVRDRQAQLAFAAEVAEWAPSPLGMVFNNAGVTSVQSVAEGPIENDEWVIGVNFGGVVNGVRAFLPILLRQDSGVIVNTSSVFGLIGFPNQAAYCASKFAVRGYTDSLRQELRECGVSAVTVHPGAVDTGIVRNARYHGEAVQDARGTHEEAIDEFAAIARTTPERAAKIIHEGVKSGKSRILVGADARMLDALVRVMPTRYDGVVAALEALVTRRGR